MKIISRTAGESGAYPPIQEGSFHTVPPGMALWPEDLGTGEFYACSGFGALTVEEVDGVPVVAAFEPNSTAWAAWKAACSSEPSVPTEQEDTAGMLVDHEYRLTLLELGLTGEGGE